MNSATSTDPGRSEPTEAGFRPWQLFMLLSMVGATATVMVAKQTHPVALLLLSAAVLGAGAVGYAIYQTAAAFMGRGREPRPLDDRVREELERDKALVLRSIKELEFDHAMGKVSDADFKDMSGRLRVKALALMQDLERAHVPMKPAPVTAAAKRAAARADRAERECSKCHKTNDADAKFCKNCGQPLA